MEITTRPAGRSIEIHVTGIVGRIRDADAIIQALENAAEQNPGTSIRLVFADTFTIPSRLIGALLNMIRNDGMIIEVIPLERMLHQLLERLNLLDLLNVTFAPAPVPAERR